MAWLQTYTGIAFPIFDPQVEDIEIEDIAHHLSFNCRFNGAVTDFYSVAQHSVLVSQQVPEEDALWGLLHDAAEAYLGDLITPVKATLAQFHWAEMKILNKVAEKYGLPWRLSESSRSAGRDNQIPGRVYSPGRLNFPSPLPKSVRQADKRMLYTERRDLLAPHPRPWAEEGKVEPYDFQIHAWTPASAKSLFLDRFYEITGEVRP